ncbi:MAG: Methylthioribose-1-phosphate isomerase [Anaerolineales bacterium]|nr:Methylthioribose-1-phosphate isomerase [Anaerolineales bacterium]
MHPEIHEQIDAIAADHLSGATDITRRAAGVLASLPVYSDTMSAGDFRAELTEVARELAAAQPSMTSLFTLVNQVLLAAEEEEEFGRLMTAVEHTAKDFGEELTNRLNQIAQTALPLIHDGATIMTISSSSTVLAALERAQEADKRFRVICLESRPQREGIDFAKQVAELEIDVTLVVDAGMAHFMDGVNTVLFGADTISPRGLVNKIGTYALALTADAHGVPAYGLAGTEKFLPASLLDRFEIEQQDLREVLDEPVHPRLDVVNVYFDLTPLHFVAGVVTEHDVLAPADVEERLRTIEIHPTLLVG